MKILKFFQYAYLIFAVLFLYDAIEKWSLEDKTRSYISLLFTVVAIFMFFFRKRFKKKFEDRNKH